MIELCDIHKRHIKKSVVVSALSGISLEIPTGKWVSLMGPSGAGKTTLLNIIGLLDRSFYGNYRLDGEDVSLLPDRERSRRRNTHFGFIFQSFNLVPQLTAWENVALPLYYAGVGRRRRHKEALSLLAQVGLRNRSSHAPAELSGGEEQRVAIARALANSPLWVLADEPTGNLDQQMGREILEILNDLNERGKGIVLVTHDSDIANHAEQTIRIVDGSVEV